ncbi:MAG TPA: DUF481 domain-containing protein [Rhodothermales bacterium]|nr:DUF481 domain-containing protein [Rhodothermales bacterium]
MPFATIRCCFLALIIGLFAQQATAQVNIERQRDLEVEGLAVSVESDIALLSGNSDVFDLGLGGRIDYRGESFHTFFLSSVRYGESNGKEYRNRAFGHLRFNYDLTPRLVGELFGQIEHDVFTLLQLRLLGGVGVRLRHVRNEQIGLYQGTALMYEFEDIDDEKSGSHPGETKEVRWSNYVNLRITLSEQISFRNTVYVQPALGDFDDVRVLDEAALVVALTKHLAFKTAFNLRYDSDPPGSIDPLDLAVRNGLTVTF